MRGFSPVSVTNTKFTTTQTKLRGMQRRMKGLYAQANKVRNMGVKIFATHRAQKQDLDKRRALFNQGRVTYSGPSVARGTSSPRGRSQITTAGRNHLEQHRRSEHKKMISGHYGPAVQGFQKRLDALKGVSQPPVKKAVSEKQMKVRGLNERLTMYERLAKLCISSSTPSQDEINAKMKSMFSKEIAEIRTEFKAL